MRYVNLSVGIENWDGRPVVTVNTTPADGLPGLQPPQLVYAEYGEDAAHMAVQLAYYLYQSLDRLTGGAIGHGLVGDGLAVQQAASGLLDTLWAMHRRGIELMPGYAVNLHGLLPDVRSLAHYAGQAMVGNPVEMVDLIEDYERSVAV